MSFKVSASGKENLRRVIRSQLESDKASSVPFEGSVQMLTQWVVGLLESRDNEALHRILTTDPE
jgi:hypothetical protein